MSYRIKLLHIGEKDGVNAKLIQQMKSSVRDESGDVPIPGINLLVNISDETVPTGNGKTPILAKSVFAFATGAILFYDVNSRKSLGDSILWIDAFRKHAPEKAVILLIANTSSVNVYKTRAITRRDGETFAESAGVLHCEASQCDLQSAKQALQLIASDIYTKIKNGKIRTELSEGVEVVQRRTPQARRNTTSCSSPQYHQEPPVFLPYPEPRRQQSENAESVPKVVRLESELSYAQNEVKRMKKTLETEKARLSSLECREQQLINDNIQLKQKLEGLNGDVQTLKNQRTRDELSFDDDKRSLSSQLGVKESEVRRLNDQVTSLQQMCVRLQQDSSRCAAFEQESIELGRALKSSAHNSALRLHQLQQQLSLKEEALQNEAQLRTRADATHQGMHLALNQARAEINLLQQHRAPVMVEENWKVARHEISFNGMRLGHGAWGYVAEGEFRGKRVAIKCLHEEIMNRQTTERVRREINTMASIRHPNVVLFIAAVLDDGPPIIVSELLDTNLRTAYEDHLVNGIQTKLDILHGVACALNYFHRQREPIIHRDISSPNILLMASGYDKWTAKVSDFGSANLAQRSQTLGEGAIIYAAPETYPSPTTTMHGMIHSTKIDVYSYGVLVGELLTEQLPNPDSLSRTLRQVEEEEPHFHALMVLCTKRNPQERPDMDAIIAQYLHPMLVR